MFQFIARVHEIEEAKPRVGIDEEVHVAVGAVMSCRDLSRWPAWSFPLTFQDEQFEAHVVVDVYRDAVEAGQGHGRLVTDQQGIARSASEQVKIIDDDRE